MREKYAWMNGMEIRERLGNPTGLIARVDRGIGYLNNNNVNNDHQRASRILPDQCFCANK